MHYSLYYNGDEIESSRESSGLAASPSESLLVEVVAAATTASVVIVVIGVIGVIGV